MIASQRGGLWTWGVSAVAVLALSFLGVAPAVAEEAPSSAAPEDEAVDLFDAIEAGQVEARFIPRDERQARLFVKNVSDQPINVRLPDAFAGVPVLQQGGFGGGGGGFGGGGGGGGSQGVGGGGGGGRNNFNIAPEEVAEAKLTTVCLEYGKPEPRANMPYEIRPIEEFTTAPGVRELVKGLGYGEIDQRVAQAAAWHLNNGMEFERMAALRTRHANGLQSRYFSRQELQAAYAVVQRALELAEQNDENSQSPVSGRVPQGL